MVGLVLLLGIPATLLLSWMLEKKGFKLKKVLLFDICLFTFITAIIPIALFTPDAPTKYAVWLIGGVLASFAFGFYYTLLWVIMLSMTPKGKIGQYSGVHSAISLLGILVGPLVASAVGQATNNQRAAMATLPVWNVLALVVVCTIDFGKAKEIAIKQEAQAVEMKNPTESAHVA